MKTFTAFADDMLLVEGSLGDIFPACKARAEQSEGRILIFEDASGKQIDFDFSGSGAEISHPPSAKSETRGRPQLGVVSREITLLPQQWEWLQAQPTSASATIRRLIDNARRENNPAQKQKERAAAVGAFLTAIAGNAPNFEEAMRALYAGDRARFEYLITDYPNDIRNHALKLLGTPSLA
jgi:hypothetical protein